MPVNLRCYMRLLYIVINDKLSHSFNIPFFYYPLTAPAVIPSMIYFWKIRKIINIGRIPNMDPAISTS